MKKKDGALTVNYQNYFIWEHVTQSWDSNPNIETFANAQNLLLGGEYSSAKIPPDLDPAAEVALQDSRYSITSRSSRTDTDSPWGERECETNVPDDVLPHI